MSKRYKVVTFGGMDGLKFPDLEVKFSAGYHLPLHVKQNDFVPLDILDPLDVRKSLVVGSLGRYIANGQVVIEDEEELLIKEKLKAIKVEEKKVEKIKTEVKKQEVKEVPSEVKPSKVESKQEEVKPLNNLSDVKSADDFNRLTYFLKLRFIRECADKTLLQQISEKTDSKNLQIYNNIRVRLTQV